MSRNRKSSTGRSKKPSKISKTRSRSGAQNKRALLVEPLLILLAVLALALLFAVLVALIVIVPGAGSDPATSAEGQYPTGWLGRAVAQYCISIWGWSAIGIPSISLLLVSKGWRRMFGEGVEAAGKVLWLISAGLMLITSFSGFLAVCFGSAAGGSIGQLVASATATAVGNFGAGLLFLSATVLSLRFLSEGFCDRLLSRSFYLSGSFLAASFRGARVLFSLAFQSFSSVFRLISTSMGSLSGAATGAGSSLLEGFRQSRVDESGLKSERGSRPSSRSLGLQDLPSDLMEGVTDSDPALSRRQLLRTANGEQGELGEELADPLPDPVISRREKADLAELKRTPKQVKTKSSDKRALDNPLAARAAQKAYQPPPLELLVEVDTAERKGPQDQQLIENSRRLEEALGNFRIGGRVVEVHPGPVITMYQYQPAAGVKVQRIINLADDLALALKVASVRVFAPVPGKGTVGIEVPNQFREIVRLREVLQTPEFQDGQDSLPLALGKDTYGDPFIASLPRMPHLLIAGATGTGKSVCINSLLLCLLFRNSPKDLRLILIDPKMLELSVYEDIPHLKAPVVTQAKRARGVLWWAVEEMERRYRLLKDVGVRDIAAYNRLIEDGQLNDSTEKQKLADGRKKQANAIIELQEKDVIATSAVLDSLNRDALNLGGEQEADSFTSGRQPEERLPRIVIVVDELADLMLTVGREIEELLTRLAQKARAAGIHLILATQRPSVNVITGLIKANFPARISFKVASKIDARTVLDCSGSEKLLGQGDMLFMSPSVGQMKRLHSPYVSDQEVHDAVEWLRAQGRPDYDDAIEEMISKVVEVEGSASSGDGGDPSGYDAFYDQAVSLVIEKGAASTSMVQRAFRIGYNRAARILETMEREGIVGPADGSKPRQVLVGSADNMI